jgi:hypothetical protein
MEAEDYAQFEAMRDAGCRPNEVSSAAIAGGLNFAENLQMLRAVFNLDLLDAKEVWIEASGCASSLNEYQERLVPQVEHAAAEVDESNL